MFITHCVPDLSILWESFQPQNSLMPDGINFVVTKIAVNDFHFHRKIKFNVKIMKVKNIIFCWVVIFVGFGVLINQFCRVGRPSNLNMIEFPLQHDPT